MKKSKTQEAMMLNKNDKFFHELCRGTWAICIKKNIDLDHVICVLQHFKKEEDKLHEIIQNTKTNR